MSLFSGTTLSLNIGKALSVLSFTFFLSACEAPRTFEDAGVYRSENYTIEIERVPTGLTRTTYISINGDKVLTIDGAAIRDASCQRMSLYVNQCTFDTQYEGKAVRVIQEVDGKLYQQNIYYSVYFDGVLIRKIVTPLQN